MSGKVNNPGTKSGTVGGFDNVENTKLSTWTGASTITTIGTVTSGGLGTGSVLDDPTITQGSDATGDTYYRAANGRMTRLAAGTDGYALTATGAGSVAAYEAITGVVKKNHYFEMSTRTAGNESANQDQYQITSGFTPIDPVNNTFYVNCHCPTDHRGNDHVGMGLRFAKLGGSSYDYYNRGIGYADITIGHQSFYSFNFQVAANDIPAGTYAVYVRSSTASCSPDFWNPNTSDSPRVNPQSRTTLMITEWKV